MLENRGDFRDLGWLRATWSIDAERRARSRRRRCRCRRSRRATAGASWRSPASRLPATARGERFLTLRFTLAEATPWAPAGFEVGWAQVALDGPGRRARPEPTVPLGPATWSSTPRATSLHPSLAAPPALALWRAPTDNDRIGGMAGRWTAWGLPALAPRARRRRARRPGDAPSGPLAHGAGHRGPARRAPRPRRATAGSASTRRSRSRDVLDDLPRVGTVLTLAPGHEACTWFGRGPHETYPDRCRGGRDRPLAVHRDRSARRRTCGRRRTAATHAVRWLEVGDRVGSSSTGRARCRRSTSAAQDLDAATHDDELRPAPGDLRDHRRRPPRRRHGELRAGYPRRSTSSRPGRTPGRGRSRQPLETTTA